MATPCEIAAMPMEQRRAAVAAIDLNALSHDEQQALLAAVMAPEPPTTGSRVMHVRKPHEQQDPGYHTSSSGHVYAKNNVAPPLTFCGAPAALDLSYGEYARRRADFDWSTLGAEACGTCLAEAAKLKAQRAAKRMNRRKS